MIAVRGSDRFLCFFRVGSVALANRMIISQLCCGPSRIKAAPHEQQHHDV